MYELEADSPLFDTLLNEREKVAFNLFERIRTGSEHQLMTDGSTFLSAQTREGMELWLYLARRPEGETLEELCAFLTQKLLRKPSLTVSTDAERAQALLEAVAARAGAALSIHMPMVAYACPAVRDGVVHGCAACSDAVPLETIAKLLQQFYLDAEGVEVTREEAMDWARGHAGSRDLMLWQDGGEIVAMSNVQHRGKRHARISCVVTERNARGRGYARMLVGAQCRALLDEGLIPMLYADGNNPVSNRCYRSIGFEACGVITKYILKRT